jgi:ATP-dependent helicase/nuclease subunit B
VHRAIEVTTPKGRTVTLHGRLDRVDARAQPPAGGEGMQPASRLTPHASREYAVIDYKTRAQKALRDALELPGEDVQLAVYALLWTAPVTAAMFLSIDRDDVAPVALEGDLLGVAEETRARLAAMLDALADGARLPAQGIDAVCAYCEVRGLCRKDHWHG